LGGYGATQPAHEQEACEEGAKNPAMMSHRERLQRAPLSPAERGKPSWEGENQIRFISAARHYGGGDLRYLFPAPKHSQGCVVVTTTGGLTPSSMVELVVRFVVGHRFDNQTVHYGSVKLVTTDKVLL
jgi:hypothetical protein